MAHNISIFDGGETGSLLETDGATNVTLDSDVTLFSEYSFKFECDSDNAFIYFAAGGINSTDGTLGGGLQQDSWSSFHFLVEELPSSSDDHLYLAGVQQHLGAWLVKHRFNSSGAIETETNNDSDWTASSDTITVGEWYQASIFYNANDVATVIVRDLSDNTVISESYSTALQGNISNHTFGCMSPSVGTLYIDNIVVEDGGGGAVDDPYNLLGVKYAVGALCPIGEGDETSTDWSNDYTYINDIPLDSDTSRVAAGTDPFLSEMQDTGNLQVDEIIAVMGFNAMRWDSSSNPSTQLRFKTNGTVYQTGTYFSAGADTVFIGKIYADNPYTSDSWAASDVDAIQIGCNKASPTGQAYVEESYLQVLFSLTGISLNQILWLL
ncbi:MAG: hypothetical protein ACW98K_17850 [Candidatus Kariarchaeaceae archaeon]|jgi:hypothetical protein